MTNIAVRICMESKRLASNFKISTFYKVSRHYCSNGGCFCVSLNISKDL